MKKYLIIGASTGIGRALAKKLAKEGHKIIGTYNSTEPQENVENLEFKKLNILDDDPDFSFLPDELHGMAYCPGSINLKPFKRLSPESFTEDYKLQVVGAVKTIQAALPALKGSEQGSIVLFSTVAVQQGFNFHSQVSASKGAIEGLTRALAAELAPSIRVNCVAPSITDTPLASRLLNTDEKVKANGDRHPLKRIGKPGDIANMAAFLLGEQSSWVTGQVLHVDGGISKLK